MLVCGGVAAIFAGAREVQAGNITYNLSSPDMIWPGYQGFVMSGTITTDGKIGELSSEDIVAWSWTLSGHWTLRDRYGHADSTIPGATATIFTGDGTPGVFATETQIVAEYPTATEAFVSIGTGHGIQFDCPDGTSLVYQADHGNFPVNYPFTQSITALLFDLGPYRSPAQGLYSFPTDDPFVIAEAVPEPASLGVLAVGGLALIARQRRWTRKV